MSMQFLLAPILLVLLHKFVYADLPIHAVTNDVDGWWEFELSHLYDQPDTCGSGIPNRNLENLQQDPNEWLKKHKNGIREKRLLYLSDTPISLSETPFIVDDTKSGPRSFVKSLVAFPKTRSQWRVLPVYEKINGTLPLVGYWTMVFDEGFEVSLIESIGNSDDIQSLKLFAFMKYGVVDDSKCNSPANGDGEKEDGSTPCYETDAGATLIGWQEFRNDTAHNWGCCHGKKIAKKSASSFPRMVAKRATVREVVLNETDNFRLHGLRTFSKTSRMIPPAGDSTSNELFPSFLETKSGAALGTGLYACTSPSEHLEYSKLMESLPKMFTWGDPFNDMNSQLIKGEILDNQGSCGSCYALAAAYTLQKRAEIMLQQLAGNETNWADVFANDDRLSSTAIISCSYYNQGCEGGFPYLVGKWAVDFGVPSGKCMATDLQVAGTCRINDVAEAIQTSQSGSHQSPTPPTRKRRGAMSNTSQRRSILSPIDVDYNDYDKSTDNTTADDGFCGADQRVYAKSYGYIGGCYECCSEREMKEEIFQHGPVTVAIDAADAMFNYRHGVFDESTVSHSRICDDPQKGLNGWEFTSHAIAIVGWGEDPPLDGSKEPQKYWIARNSWGDRWGRGGYIKIARGKNLGAIEAQAVYIDPDPTRGKLKILLEDKGVTPEAIKLYLRC